eukprot:399595-Amphidinium_carterae.1
MKTGPSLCTLTFVNSASSSWSRRALLSLSPRRASKDSSDATVPDESHRDDGRICVYAERSAHSEGVRTSEAPVGRSSIHQKRNPSNLLEFILQVRDPSAAYPFVERELGCDGWNIHPTMDS